MGEGVDPGAVGSGGPAATGLTSEPLTGNALPVILRTRLALAGIALAALAVYANTFGNAWVYPHVADIVDNPTLKHLWPIWPVLMPPATGGLTVGGRPLVNLSLAINYALGGTAVGGYHAVNLLIHILAGLTLFGIVRRTLALRGRAEDEGDRVLFAFAVEFLWTLHPLQTEAVTYVVERAESLMGLFYLLTLYCFIRSADSAAWQFAAVLCCLFGMATKEVMATAPVVVLLYDRTFISGTLAAAWRRHRRLYLGLACTWVLVIYLALATGSRGGTAGFGTGIAWWSYVQIQFGAIVHYLRLAIWPHPLIFDYGTQGARGGLEFAIDAIGVAALLAATAWAWIRRPIAGFLGASFFAILAPTSLVPIVVQTMAERRMYLPLAAVLVLVVWSIQTVLRRCGALRTFLPLILLAGLALGLTSFARNADYRSNLTLWSLTARQRPESPRAHYYFGVSEDEAGRPEAGRQAFMAALRLDPNYPEAHNRLGIDLLRLGQRDEAMAHYQAAIRAKPDFAEAHYNLGTALAEAAQTDAAVRELETSLRLKPDFPDAESNLGLVLARADRLADALPHLERAARLAPTSAFAHDNLARALAAAGRSQEAAVESAAAAKLAPTP